MANEEYLKILEQGVEVWNQWRKENPDIAPSIDEANFFGFNLCRANLSGMSLLGADFSASNLSGANLSGAKLNGSNFNGSNLSGANLNRACLYGTKLVGVNLSEADVSKAELGESDLLGANLSGANLSQTDLYGATLIKTNFTQATITGAKLYGTSRDDWIIKGIKCDYVYWDAAKILRSPKDRYFAPGEFEQIYSTLPIIEYIFQDGMLPIDHLIMEWVVKTIRQKKQDFDLKIDSINNRGLAPSIRFTVQQEEYKEPALQEIKNRYEPISMVCMETAFMDKLMKALEKVFDKPSSINQFFAGPNSVIAIDGSTISIDKNTNYIDEIYELIAKEPENSQRFGIITKKRALDIVRGAMDDIAKEKIKTAADKIVDLCKKLGPWIMGSAAYAYFKSKGIEL